jgi:hypothetical protein
MTDTEINVAIAKALGARKDVDTAHWILKGHLHYLLPNYTEDLNHMHEAEKMLTEKQWIFYGTNLDVVVFPQIHASARERATAFLKTLGLWEDEK